MLTAVLAATMLGLLLIAVLLWAWLLRFGLQWAKIKELSIWKIIAATTLAFVIQAAISTTFYAISPNDPAAAVLLGLAELTLNVLAPWLVIMVVFKAGFLRSAQAWLPTLAAPVIMVLVSYFLVRTWLFEPFSAPTNSMAPTLLGEHWQGTCPECGSPTYGSPVDERYNAANSPLMICRDNFHVTQPTEWEEQARPRDRFFVAKFLPPQRWDIILFRYPEDPATLYVKRLVGLPGEEITIRDGHVWADGEKLAPPDSIRGVRYVTQFEHWSMPVWGSPERPAPLSADEYFVLGDFSPRASDSRLWQRAAPGHNPYAVPESYIVGVVTHIYWPADRWRAWR